jgi:hypothetical protein
MSKRFSLVGRGRGRYAGEMPIGRQPDSAVHPIRHLQELDRYAGKWVAVKDQHVVAFAENSSDLALRVRALGDKGRGAVMQLVQPTADAFIVGVG